MRAARRSYLRSDAKVEVQHEAVTTSIRKTMRPADHPTNRELRKRRDLVWWILANLNSEDIERTLQAVSRYPDTARRRGMNSTEIHRACLFAARSPEQIRNRLIQFRRHYQRKYRDA